MTGRKSQKPYGFVLVLRGLAKAAIDLGDRPAALRVLCVMADYMNAEGECKCSQETVALRLGITRQAVNQHIRLLDERDILVSVSETKSGRREMDPAERQKSGRTLHYKLNTEGLEEQRAGQWAVDMDRQNKDDDRLGIVLGPKRIAGVKYVQIEAPNENNAYLGRYKPASQ